MASPFWQYFHDKLNWPAIFRPGPVSALAKGLALYMDDVREDILWLRRQWNPATADDERIAAYGASRGILRTRYDTDESYRLRVVNAFAWHKLGGKVQGLVRILAENGFAGAVIVPVNDVRRHDAAFSHNGAATYNDGLCWAQFDVKLVEIPEQGLNADILAWFRWLVNEYKPARSILRAMSWKTNLEDETAFTEGDGVWLAVKPEYEDRRKWGFPLHDGSIRYDNGLFRAHEIPKIVPIVVDKPGLDVACGAIGIGEITSIPTAPAIADAYFRYDGERRTKLPLANTPYERKGK